MLYSDSEKQRISGLIATAVINKDTAYYDKYVIPKIVKNKEKYFAVADAIGCPAAFVAAIHVRENYSDVGRFTSYLGNGQPLNKVTTIKPKGRGPFPSWESGAIDAFIYDGIDEVKEWDLPKFLFYAEKYNGFGYRNRGINSPYPWNFTNHYTRGSYVSDGAFSASAVDGNVGVYALYLRLIEADSDFAINKEVTAPPATVVVESEPAWLVAIKKFFETLLNWLFGPNTAKNAKTEEQDPPTKTYSLGDGPRITREEVEEILIQHGIDTSIVTLLVVRGYYLDTMGVAGVNDRRIYDDALIWFYPGGFMTFRGNADPNGVRKGFGTAESTKGMASLKPGVWDYQKGLHKGYEAFIQADKVTVIRDGSPDYEDTGWFGINVHRGGVTSTSSLGCLTIPPASWDTFKELGYDKLSEYGQRTFKLVLIREEERRV